MRWIIFFAASWIIFLYLIDWKKLKANIWCGMWAALLALIVDMQAVDLGLYKIEGPLMFANTTPFFLFGPVFVIGTLLAQFYPRKRFWRIINIIVLTAIYSAIEIMLVISGDVVYMNWHLYNSLTVNILALMVIGWFSVVVLNKGKEG
ncbi:hypothetical protein CDQ84_01645 [Clostridium thermosuccinogenes]|jgi:hypothetical protein|uniref:Uncharacterized protein n=1 Tax=Clostridium thermosuccinogenes TaxID=84032 RepID=A0A2K2F463_9CLOT|nr:hypothetical protein [Pseudoclostridium thermosuccinogenes]AUS95688.1 hypothetical protein CDO33_04080 [Pseudoclostridium thermosuccinogenes]PNT93587.1 hypothetical protein CDQ83_08845 [Pseudoclostridium thermosuccinogenes]PNT99949.1 hypothetical protein CDQ85_01645 [Pseudoclostridium thermosuccinogenes]PNU01394.1 hypothetical protein CDQ84_01645 [Pseudoclostridium thermosuccinogenes]